MSEAAGGWELLRGALNAQMEEHANLLMRRDFVPHMPGLSAALSQLQKCRTEADVARHLLGRQPEGTFALVYAMICDRLHSFLLDREGLRGHGCAAVRDTDVNSTVDALRYALLARSIGSDRARDIMPWAAPHSGSPSPGTEERGTALLLNGELRSALLAARHLIVVPTLNIGTAPFAALEPGPPGKPLIARTTITIAPSIIDLALPAEPWQLRGPRALVVGNPTPFPGGPQPLPAAQREAEAAARRFGVDPLTGPEASYRQVLSRMPEADVLYFATHGSSGGSSPLDEGSLLLAGGERLTARQIQQLSLKARLAVLSACQTGLGGVHRGGMIGLARAFQLAGVPRVVMSLWNVDDEATFDLMDRFTAALSECPPHQALQQAMLRLRPHRPQPAQWASFVTFGR